MGDDLATEAAQLMNSPTDILALVILGIWIGEAVGLPILFVMWVWRRMGELGT